MEQNEKLQNEMLQNEMLHCTNCGALIPEDSAKCPYCGALNVTGGEKQYMENLFGLKDDVEELKSVPLKEYKKELGRTGRLLRRVLVILAVMGVLFGLIYIWLEVPVYEQPSVEDLKAQTEWQRENFPKLDAMYEEGDYDAILEFEASECGDGKYSLSAWEHYDFIDVYRWYASAQEYAAEHETDGYDKDSAYWYIINAMYLLRDISYAEYDDYELEQIDAYKEEVIGFLDSQFGMAKEETKELYASCCKEDKYGVYLDYKRAEKKIKEYIKNNLDFE